MQLIATFAWQRCVNFWIFSKDACLSHTDNIVYPSRIAHEIITPRGPSPRPFPVLPTPGPTTLIRYRLIARLKWWETETHKTHISSTHRHVLTCRARWGCWLCCRQCRWGESPPLWCVVRSRLDALICTAVMRVSPVLVPRTYSLCIKNSTVTGGRL